jgi:hypothetical protein
VRTLAIPCFAKLETKMSAVGDESALLCRVDPVHGSIFLVPWFALAGAHCEGIRAPLVGDSHRPTQVLLKVLLEARDRVL